jgi:hypothetical protein
LGSFYKAGSCLLLVSLASPENKLGDALENHCARGLEAAKPNVDSWPARMFVEKSKAMKKASAEAGLSH